MPQRINPESGKGYRFRDRVGRRNGRLLFTRHLGIDKHKHHVWEAVCDCGVVTTTTTPSKTRSCGCIHREVMARIQSAKALPKDEKRHRVLENRKRQRERRRKDPVRAMSSRISRLHRHALAKIAAIKSSATFKQLGYTPKEFAVHIERQFKSGMGWHNMADWQIDHIVPVSVARTIDDVIALNQLSNLRPMWAQENNAKKDRRESLL